MDEVRGLVDLGLREGQTARLRLVVLAVEKGQHLGVADSPARERTFIGTRRYVRRQRSWFRRDRRVRWVDGAAPDSTATALALLADSAVSHPPAPGPRASERLPEERTRS
jgi:tRNA dimethylallyltransferase